MATITMNEMGEVIFEEYGRRITDPSEITYIKRHSDWKTKVYKLSIELMNQINDEIEKNITIHCSTPKMISENEIQTKINSLYCNSYIITNYSKASFQEINNKAITDANRYADVNTKNEKFWKKNKLKKELAAAKLQEFIDFYSDKDADSEAKYYEEENQKKLKRDAEYLREYESKKRALEDIITDNEKLINSQLDDCFRSLATSSLPAFKIKGSYNKSLNNTCIISLELPSKDCIDTRKGNMLASGKISVKARPAKDILSDWNVCCYGLILNIVGHIFNVNTSIKTVRISTQYNDLNRTTGYTETKSFADCCFERNSFSSINFSNIDPEMTVNSFAIKTKTSPIPKQTKPSSAKPAKVKKAKYEIDESDELNNVSLDIIYNGIKVLSDRYTISILSDENKNRLLGAIKDILPKNEAEQSLMKVFINNDAFCLLLSDETRIEAEEKITKIIEDNKLSNSDDFINKIKDLM